MEITHQSILQSIYASSALATLNADHRATLLHPDHAEALTALIPDAVGIVIARCDNLSLNVRYDNDYVEVEIPDYVAPDTFAGAFRTAIMATLLYLIRLSYQSHPDFPTAEIETLNATAPPISEVKISPCYF